MFRLDLVAQTAATPIHNPVYAFTAGIWLLQKRNYYRIPKNVQQCFQIRFSLFSMLPLPYPSPKKKHSVIYPHWYSWPFLLLLVRKKSSAKGGLVVLLHRWIFGRENPLGPATSLTHTTTPPPCTVYPEIDFAYVRLIRIAQPFISHSNRKKFATFSKV